MDMDRPPHFRTSTATAPTSELFICFTSRLSSSSSSMKLSKSILSPGRAARDGGPASLSSSLSRRLRTNGSLKGGQASPFFTTTGKKRGCAFENPEPSSPKVTCIGQVRVKTKKKVKQSRSLSRRRSGEVSFRRAEEGACADEDKAPCSLQQQQQRHSNASAHYQPPQECAGQHRNQRWVHLPVSICEALRAFGAEFSCLFPCKSSCFSTSEREKGGEKQRNENGCGAVFAPWLVSVNDDEGGKKREIELVVGGGDEEEESESERVPMRRSSRRHVFENIEVKDDRIEVKGQSVEDGGEEEAEAAARVSICIPPKNALLLMRCRSDPMKMAALAGRFSWDAHAAPASENDVDEETEKDIADENEGRDEEKRDLDQEEEEEVAAVCEIIGQKVSVPVERDEEHHVADELEAEASSEMEVAEQQQREEELANSIEEMVEREVEEELHQECIPGDDDDHEEALLQEEEEEVESNMSSFEALLDQEIADPYENCPVEDKDVIEDIPVCHFAEFEPDEAAEDSESNQAPSVQLNEAPKENEHEATVEEHETFVNNDQENHMMAQAADSGDNEEEDAVEVTAMPPTETEAENLENPEIMTTSNGEELQKAKLEKPTVPECLLLMMCEPKLSMEVSKETWVCSTDFIRWLPERPRRSAKAMKLSGGRDHEPAKARLSIDSKPKKAPIIPQETNNDQHRHQQPPRSSCTLPAPATASMTTMIEQKLVNAVGYEPFVLTRCKSEPMRTAATKLIPESCLWKNSIRELEPHRRATLGVGGAAGVGF